MYVCDGGFFKGCQRPQGRVGTDGTPFCNLPKMLKHRGEDESYVKNISVSDKKKSDCSHLLIVSNPSSVQTVSNESADTGKQVEAVVHRLCRYLYATTLVMPLRTEAPFHYGFRHTSPISGMGSVCSRLAAWHIYGHFPPHKVPI